MALLEKDEVIEYLKKLSISELGSIIHSLSEHHREDSSYNNGDFEYCDVLALAICHFGRSNGIDDDSAIIELYSRPSISTDNSSTLTEQGNCTRCKSLLVSHSKEAYCSVCHQLNELT